MSGLGSGPGRTPQSSRAGGQPTLTPGVAWRIAALGVIAVGLIAVLVVRLWFMQVIGSEAYAERAEVNRLRTVVVEPERGMITDREGKVLVGNSPATNVVARPRELTGARRERVLRRLAPLLDTPYAELDATVAAGENTPYQSVAIASDIDPKLAISLQERPRQFPGISLQQSYVRDYRQTPDGQPHAAHAVGYTGAITEDRIASYRERGYLGDERVGVTGLEASYETFLRGTPGEVRVEVDAAGQPVGRGVVSSVAPSPGSNVETSIDSGTQRALEDALRTRTKLNGLAEGAAGVALDPRTGEVLAIASFPSFDPGAFTDGRPKDIARLYRDPLRPLFDRTTQGSYPAASTFKAITGAAALQERVVTPDTALDSPGVITLYDQEFQNYGQQWHGNITMPVALEVSSDTFFYQVADNFFRRADSPLQEWSTRFGLGSPTGIDLPQGAEAPGVVPTPAWKRQTFSGPEFGEIDRIWKPGDTIQLAIGQNFLEVTPLQMARAYGAIANGGELVTPTLVRRVVSPSGREERNLLAARERRDVGLSESTIETLQAGLYRATNGGGGTATAVFGGLPADAKVAGKTGTAEVPPKQDHSWFVGYAPAEDPEIVVAVVVEHAGTGANAAAPAVCQVITAHLGADGALCGDGAEVN